MKENNRGVTLIALAITIIVLLIISGITITAGSYNAEKAKDNKLLSEVVMVQNAVLQRKTKAELINGHYPGQKLTEIGINIDEVISKVNSEKVDEYEIIEKKDTNESNYYLLSNENGGIKELNIKNTKDEYIVNYVTGEVINYTNCVTGKGEPVYVYSIKNKN